MKVNWDKFNVWKGPVFYEATALEWWHPVRFERTFSYSDACYQSMFKGFPVIISIKLEIKEMCIHYFYCNNPVCLNVQPKYYFWMLMILWFMWFVF